MYKSILYYKHSMPSTCFIRTVAIVREVYCKRGRHTVFVI